MESAWRTRTLLVTAIAVVLPSCDSSSDDGPTGSTGSFSIAVSPATSAFNQNSSTSVDVSLTRTGGFADAVTLSISGAPTGVTASMNPAVLTGAALTSRIDLTSSATSVLGTSTVTITGTSGTRQSSTAFALTVSAPPDYALSVLPTVSVAVGGSSDVNVTISRANFTGGVTLSLVDPPAGVTGTFSPQPSTAGTAMLSLSVGPNVPVGQYPLTIRGSATGPGERTVSLMLAVIPASTGSNNVEYRFCGEGEAPAFFAYQDGTQAWQAIPGTVTGDVTRYAFNITSGRGGILLVYPYILGDARAVRSTGSRLAARRSAQRLRARAARTSARAVAAVEAYETFVFHGSTAELATDGASACGGSTAPTKTIRGTVAGLGTFQYSVLTLGNVSRIFEGGVNTNPVTFADVQSGPVVFLGSRLPSTGSAPDRGVIFRNVNIPDGGSLPSPIDFNGPASFVPSAATVEISGAPGDRFEVYNHVHTASGPVRLWNDISPSQVSNRPWTGLPASQLAAGEFHDILVFASPAANSPDFRVATKYVGPVANETVAFSPAVNPAAVSSVSTGAYPRLRFQGVLPADYNKGLYVVVGPDEGSYFIVLATNAWLAAAATATGYDLTMPDVAGLPGFPTASRLPSGQNFVTTEAFGFTGPGTFEPVPAIGVVSRVSIRTGTVSVP